MLPTCTCFELRLAELVLINDLTVLFSCFLGGCVDGLRSQCTRAERDAAAKSVNDVPVHESL